MIACPSCEERSWFATSAIGPVPLRPWMFQIIGSFTQICVIGKTAS